MCVCVCVCVCVRATNTTICAVLEILVDTDTYSIFTLRCSVYNYSHTPSLTHLSVSSFPSYTPHTFSLLSFIHSFLPSFLPHTLPPFLQSSDMRVRQHVASSLCSLSLRDLSRVQMVREGCVPALKQLYELAMERRDDKMIQHAAVGLKNLGAWNTYHHWNRWGVGIQRRKRSTSPLTHPHPHTHIFPPPW